MITFKSTTRYGTTNNIDELERRLERDSTRKMQVYQIRSNGKLYNLIFPSYIMPSINQYGQCMMVEERRVTSRDLMMAQAKGRPLTSSRMLVNEYRSYELLACPDRRFNCPVLYVDNH